MEAGDVVDGRPVAYQDNGEVDKLDNAMSGIHLAASSTASIDTSLCQTTPDIETLKHDLHILRQKSEAQETTITTLRAQLNTSLTSPSPSSTLPNRLYALERANTLLTTENTALKSAIQDASRQTSVLDHEISGATRKLKGANKKAAKAKTVADKEGEKAQQAVHEKQQRLAAERRMRAERNETLMELGRVRKENEGLKRWLDVERCGMAHLRDGDGLGMEVDVNETTVVVPIEWKIRREDWSKMGMVLEANRLKITEQFERWYEAWRKSGEEEDGKIKKKVVGAVYEEDERMKIRIGTDLYEDVTEGDGLGMYVPQTGAEHAGWRDKRGLQDMCRRVQDGYNDSKE
jgi:hypothetical protein